MFSNATILLHFILPVKFKKKNLNEDEMHTLRIKMRKGRYNVKAEIARKKGRTPSFYPYQ